jgi:hypothetical protein
MPTQYRDITAKQARQRLHRAYEFASGQEPERSHTLARIDMRLVNRELLPFGYSIDVASYASNRYVPLKAARALANPGPMSWCCRLILLDIGLKIVKHRREFFESEFAKAQREYRRRMDMGFVDIPQQGDTK